jgi:hypothetical protein
LRAQEATDKLRLAQTKAIECARALKGAATTEEMERLFRESDAAQAEWAEAENELTLANEELKRLTTRKN